MEINRNYNYRQIERMKNLLCENRNQYKIDLHIHTNYSADGMQTVDEAIRDAKNQQFDIISIADHDSINAYQEISQNDMDTLPIIIPGIEFTVWYPEYEGRCHVLKYFYNTSDTKLQDCLEKNKNAFLKRISIWFERIEKNGCLQYFFKEFDIRCNESDYICFLDRTHQTPEYTTIAEYIFFLLNQKGIDVWMVYKKMRECNAKDECIERKEKREKLLNHFYYKYKNQDIAHNYRKLKPLIAPRGIDDADYKGYLESGSLSVNEYGQISILELKNSGFNILAHPDENRLYCIDNLSDLIAGVEVNYRSEMLANKRVYDKALKNNLLLTKGSDKHSSDDSYSNMNFYNISRKELQRLINFAEKVII